ncbi:bll0873 [Bradyrhizobium diazoefficiens USDA 110]|uniref:Bll0873 protein n=1 Tax=Bradyrhizobium diazoefficiens (strain JCM 10833 / BCRC 13528 / IAM 13628 / NBRC 14792 / USDA 110) TaxID=224911 RepID=Q89W20_BRADU|nr:plasmid partitioning protein RepB C-terminal domain-containing protein [Bradyrhizobium diazoefficiens]AND86599.1 plasmid stablization protein ParB [Bradyrhizobium diazoefficiens USDA 110]QBP19820.1 chromosome partitioning protein ParB [Bradyrhizobium diazoefficiens]BAC46138.1 bll0873 [Bradyrhizobium diazoefficiens USDA 110]BCF40400.1 chromosome partitioning protein ParB [Bradyrhizobium diazoefficiens]BCF66538.1 chromosome partitioning protein ParB [Bradyrhizobium diazoefficiens]
MNRYFNPGEIVQAFSSDAVLIDIAAILPVRAIGKAVKSSRKYEQIVCSIREIGMVEPPVVCRDKQATDRFLLLDGHLRIEALKDLGETQVECLLSNDDEAFTYNKRISRLSAIQEQRMIAKAIERHVPKEKIARALSINVRSLVRKATLVEGICEEAVALLKDKMCPMAVFDVLRKMIPIRQIEMAELLINANNYSVGYASAILAGTPQAQLVNSTTPKRIKGMTAEALSRMEGELSRLQQAITSIQDTYGQDHLHLTVLRGYLAKLVDNTKVAKYLERRHPEFFSEFRNIVETTA